MSSSEQDGTLARIEGGDHRLDIGTTFAWDHGESHRLGTARVPHEITDVGRETKRGLQSETTQITACVIRYVTCALCVTRAVSGRALEEQERFGTEKRSVWQFCKCT